MKTELTKSLARKHHTISSMYPMLTSDPKGIGVESFYPRCFHLKSTEGCSDFLHDYFFTQAETVIKKFTKSYERGENPLEHAGKGNIPCKERLLICCNLIRKKLQDPDDLIDKKNGKGYRGKLRLNAGEWNCLKRGDGEMIDSFRSFVKK